MNQIEFKKKLDSSMNMQLIVAGMTGLIEDEGYSVREVFGLLEATKQNTFHALLEIRNEGKK
ncbi:hypothetical protein CAI16_05325 [Virgibacillus dokdonensis]|uniref:Uncharacterized protein n=1 Tax=Virgibacillus dokdonensis TaxID=302167 RepID=A0A3E0WTB6_9BACI|nr:hypothetical protein [Virgibacillus dokdonensis]RFA36214.1 hypothetical protein CAI16_05325 [Virgibacillus dokdonensis]